MGITGLLPYLKKASRPANIKEFKGCTVAIDSYCWLHKGAFACAEKLAMGEKTDQYVYYCMKYVNFLLAEGIKPVMVFDGCHLPSKRDVEKARRERRDTYRKKAAQFLREGKRAEARDCLTKCIDITPLMALELMNTCRSKGVDCIVAPYEADAQLAYLAKVGIAQVIITEDSDLVLFGCDKVIFKMDFAGNGILIEKKNLNCAMDLRPDMFTFDKFRYMCILSGCDYLSSLPGIGLGKATKLFKLTRQTDMKVVLKKLPTTLNMSSLTVPDEYIAGFQRADHTFLYQLVYDPMKRALVPLNPYPPEVVPDEMDYAGPHIEKNRAFQIALGNIDIYSGQKIADFDPDTYKPSSQGWKNTIQGKNSKDMLNMLSIWSKQYRPMSKISSKQKEDTILSHMTTKGHEVTVSTKKVLPRKSPAKRKIQEPEDDPLTENDLLSTYHADSIATDIRQQKRSRYDDASLADCLGTTRSPSPKKSCHATPTKGSKSPRGKILSPPSGRNVFAAANQKPKSEKFDLNATKKLFVSPKKEVKSRFFKERKPMRQTDFFKELDRGHEEVEHPEEEEEEEDEEEEQNGIDSASGENTQNTESRRVSIESGENPSPYRSFGFCSKKVGSKALDKFKSNFDRTENSVKPFTPVMPKTVSMESLTEKRRSLLSETQKSGMDDSYEDFDTSASQKSNLYSIDSFSQLDVEFDSSQNISNSEIESRSSLEPGTREFVSSQLSNGGLEYGCTKASRMSLSKSKGSSSFYHRLSTDNLTSTRNEKLDNVIDLSEDAESEKINTKAESSKPLSGCRTSGLSKSTKKGRLSKNKSNTENQPAISNFFKNFTYDKSSSGKLTSSSASSEKKVLSPHKDN